MKKTIWDKKWENRQLEAPNNFAKRVFNLIKKDKINNLLDLGCGVGRDSVFFANKGYKVTAVDSSVKGLQILKNKKADISCSLQDIKNLKFKNDFFDVVYAHLSLHYFDDKTTKQILNKIYKILKPGGYLFIKCKSVDDALYGVGKKVGSDMYKKDKEWARHFFSKNYMREIMYQFEILKLRRTSSVYHDYKSAFIEVFAKKK